MLVLNGQKSIFGKVLRCPPVNLFGGTKPVGVLKGEAPIKGVGIGEVVVDSNLIIVFVNGLGKVDPLSRGSIPKVNGRGSG